ncbi:MAG: DUF2530 domain-containing protein [Gordonia sp. (in: high G+C Gram-positive bacteria)]|uniref:DUF2530 domain-containing protein n=1 Tax=Gordonia TaxID=2053 RepID=UPI003263E481
MSHDEQIPPLPPRLRAPEPVIVAGMAIWAVATLVVWLTGVGSDRALVVCLVGLVVGIMGTTLVLVQKAAVRRGSRGAQEGLDAP